MPKGKRASIGYLISPTKTYSGEAYLMKEALEGDFVYLLDEDREKVIGRIDSIYSQYSKEEEVETYAELSIYGVLNASGKIELKRKPMPPETKMYKMEPQEVADFLHLNEGLYVGVLSQSKVKISINPDNLLRGHTLICGKTGSGKSWTMGVLLEEVSKLELPAIIIDPHGEYVSLSEPFKGNKARILLKTKWGLKPQGFPVKVIDVNPDAVNLGDRYILVSWLDKENTEPIVGIFQNVLIPFNKKAYMERSEIIECGNDMIQIYIDMFKEKYDRDPVLSDNEYTADIFVDQRLETSEDKLKSLPIFKIRKASEVVPIEKIMETGVFTVIDLHRCDPDETRAVADWLEDRLFLLRKQKKISPFVNVIEEAHSFAPSVGKVWSSETMEMLSKEARKFGMPTWFVSQRPQLVSTTIRANCENWIVHKVTHPSDQAAIIGACEGLDANSAEMIKNLPVGVAFLTGTIVEFPLVVEIRHKQSQHHYELGFRKQLEEYEKVPEEA